ncbi:MAG: GNAT family N-acetyltransferase [Acidimicrobiales bacterium]
MDPPEAALLLERGLATSWARQTRLVPGSTIRHLGGLLVALSGIVDQTQQVAVVEGPVPEPGAAVIAAEICFDRARWRPAFDLIVGAHPDIEAVLERRGFEVVVSRPGMVRPLTQRDWQAPDPGVVLELGTSVERDQIVELQRVSFDLTPATASGMVGDAMFADPDIAIIVARTEIGGAVVGSVTVHLDPAAAAIVGTAVDPRHRQRGIGTALTAAALDLAAAHRIPHAWLQATTAGEGVYDRLGFARVARCDVWLR